MSSNLFVKLGMIVITLICFVSACSDPPDDKIIIKGSTTMAPILGKIIQQYNRNKQLTLTVDAVGTQNGLSALIEGTCHIASASAPASTSHEKAAADKGIKLKSFLFGHDLIVPVAHPGNTINNLELNQLKDIFSGNASSWRAVGGKDAKIVVVSRNRASGTRRIWDRVVLGDTPLTDAAVKKESNSSVLAFVADNENAVGYVSLAFVNQEVKAVKVNNIAPTLSYEQKGVYPIFRPLYLYVDGNRFSKHIKSLVAFVLSPTGQGIIQQNGFVPAAAKISEDKIPGT
jgi:phosphate transport system substrate-binding protein